MYRKKFWKKLSFSFLNFAVKWESFSSLRDFSLFRLEEIFPPVNAIWEISHYYDELKTFDNGDICFNWPLGNLLYLIPTAFASPSFQS